MIKTYYIKFLLYLGLLMLPLVGQAQLYIAGTVNDEKTGEGIQNKEVNIVINDSLLLDPPLITDKYGQFKDTLMSDCKISNVRAFVYDCKYEARQVLINNPGNIALFNFDICTNNLIHVECEAHYIIEPDSNNAFKFKFYNKSIEPDTNLYYKYLWDFGDGTFSSEENPEHIYEESGLYTVCLRIQDTLGNCDDEFCAPLQVPYQGECDASYTYTQQGPNPLNYQFIDLSYGNYYSWEWDFGDGNTSNQPNPMHAFEEPGAYFVCLRIHDQTLTCDDTFCDTVYVTGTVQCYADYTYEIDTNDTRKVYFTDQSLGNVTQWEWDFGDGNTSSQQNPTHKYNENGSYEVCLWVSNDDTLNCYDVYCKTIIIQSTVECNADFNAHVDSTSAVQNLFYFEDMSTGNITAWHWDFGDGTFSDESDPTHEYQESGTYEVCLTITGPDDCSDTHCQTVQTLKYFDLGGLVFAGDYPLNNPVPTGDTGIAYLYKKYPDNLHMAVDTFRFYHGGYYWFVNIIEGDYMLKISLTEHSSRYEEYFPTYFSDELNWVETSGLPLWDSNYYSANVHLTPTVPLPDGNCMISGNVHWCDTSQFSSSMRGKLNRIMVMLADESDSPLKYTHTDQNGQFSFNGLPNGHYRIFAEMAGMYSTVENIDLESNNHFSGAKIVLCESEIIGIPENNEADLPLIKLYPNPASDFVNLEVKKVFKERLFFSLYNLLGAEVHSMSIETESNRQIELNGMQDGIYFYRISNENNEVIVTGKIIKN